MIYVLTVHWKKDFWVDVQLSRLRKYLRVQFKVYAFCDGTKRDHSSKFDYCSTITGIRDHATKLNALADMVCGIADDDDVLLFCDSDAFPLRDITDYHRRWLDRFPLVAVQRLENAGDMQPHPCFCFTTVGFWRTSKGDWRQGHTWTNRYGTEVTDVGGNLLGLLEEKGVEWGKLLRTNTVDFSPVCFGVYDRIIYHHGAGSRPSIGGRAVRFAELTALDPAAAHAREMELHRKFVAEYNRVIDVLLRDDDEKFLALFHPDGPARAS